MMNKFFYCLTVFSCAISIDVMAQVYKCTDMNGKISYAESPCPNSNNGSSKNLKVKEVSEAQVLESKQRVESDKVRLQNYQQSRKLEEAREMQRRAELNKQEFQSKVRERPANTTPPNHFDNVREIMRQREMYGDRY